MIYIDLIKQSLEPLPLDNSQNNMVIEKKPSQPSQTTLPMPKADVIDKDYIRSSFDVIYLNKVILL